MTRGVDIGATQTTMQTMGSLAKGRAEARARATGINSEDSQKQRAEGGRQKYRRVSALVSLLPSSFLLLTLRSAALLLWFISSHRLLSATDPLDTLFSRRSGVTATLNNVVFGNGRFVAVGADGAIVTSPDGILWTPRNSGVTTSLAAVAYGDGLWVAVGFGGVIVRSTDGDNWTPEISGTVAPLLGVAYGNGVFVAAGGEAVLMCADG